MADNRGSLLAAILGFVAAGLALIAAAIGYSRDGKVEWSLLAGALFMAALGWASLQRSKSSGGPGGSQGSEPKP